MVAVIQSLLLCGMPRISEKIERAAFFLYGLSPETGEIEVGGTGCIILYNLGVNVASYYAVTNWHVVHHGFSCIRLNLAGGGSELIEYDPSKWTLIKEYDLSVIDITDKINKQRYSLSWIEVNQFALKHQEPYIGDDVFMMGLFDQFCNEDQNTPVARFGNICRPAENKYPVEIERVTKMPCHLVDMRSRPGFSGSPVWVYRTPATDLSEFHARGATEDVYKYGADARTGRPSMRTEWVLAPNPKNMFLRFLGIHSSQFNEYIDAKVRKKTERTGDPLKEGDRLIIPSSITMVIPAHCIFDVLKTLS